MIFRLILVYYNRVFSTMVNFIPRVILMNEGNIKLSIVPSGSIIWNLQMRSDYIIFMKHIK